MNELLKWSVENSSTTANDPSAAPPTNRGLSAAALNALMGGPSDADLMVESMTAIKDPSISLDQKMIAFDNFEQLIENLDNANNLGPLALWTPLLECLEAGQDGDEDGDLKRMAAWCVGTAVQNNEKSQERLLAMGGIEKLVRLVVDEGNSEGVRRKGIYALSSAVRNYQPAMDVLTGELGKIEGRGGQGVKRDAADMDSVDELIGELREEAKSKKEPNGA